MQELFSIKNIFPSKPPAF